MITGTAHVTAFVNGIPVICRVIDIDRECIDTSTNLPKADPRWSHTDAAGHYHAYSSVEDGLRYPTLKIRVERIPCTIPEHGTDCEGSNITHWHCRICDVEITPRTIPGPHHESVPGRTTWSARLRVPSESLSTIKGLVSLRVTMADVEYFGTGLASCRRFESGQPYVDVDITGTSPLGQRQAVYDGASACDPST